MFDAQCDLAAMVYERDQDPDEVLRDFASHLNARGYRAVGLVQTGHYCLDAPKLSAMLVHNGEQVAAKCQNLPAGAAVHRRPNTHGRVNRFHGEVPKKPNRPATKPFWPCCEDRRKE